MKTVSKKFVAFTTSASLAAALISGATVATSSAATGPKAPVTSWSPAKDLTPSADYGETACVQISADGTRALATWTEENDTSGRDSSLDGSD